MQTLPVAALLRASFRAWDVDARVHAGDGAQLAARITTGSGEELGLARAHVAHRARRGWAFGPLHAPRERWTRAASLLALLAPLRSHLDPAFEPARAIVGVRPRAERDDAATDPR